MGEKRTSCGRAVAVWAVCHTHLGGATRYVDHGSDWSTVDEACDLREGACGRPGETFAVVPFIYADGSRAPETFEPWVYDVGAQYAQPDVFA